MRQQAVDHEPETVPKSFGCLPHKTLKLSLSRNWKSSRSSSSSSGNLSSPVAAATARDLKSPSASSEINGSTSSRESKKIISSNRSWMQNNNKEEEEVEDQYREVFRRFDNDKDGKISALGLRSYFASVGEYMSSEDAEAVISDVDSDGDKLIDFEDFLRFMKKKKNNEEEVKAAFEKFEMEKGCGRITPKSLQRTLSRLGDSKSYEECVAIIKVLDTEDKGEIGYPEFYSMMMHGLT